MRRRTGQTPYPKSLSYALVINVIYGAILLAATAMAYAVKVVLQGESLYANEYHVFIQLSIIYSLLIFLLALITQALSERVGQIIETYCASKGPDAFFSKDYIRSTIGAVAIATLIFGTLLFIFLMAGLAHFMFAAGG